MRRFGRCPLRVLLSVAVAACGSAGGRPSGTQAPDPGVTDAPTAIPSPVATPPPSPSMVPPPSSPATATAGPTTTAEPASAVPLPVARVVRERRVSPNASDLTYPYDSAFEPSVATHPEDARRIAVVYQRRTRGGTCGLDTTLRVSRDGGATWRTARGRPYAGSGRGPSFHAVIAWGPGPRPGSARRPTSAASASR